VQSSSDTPHAPHTVESLLRVVEARESEVAFLKLVVDKLKLQLLRRTRSQFGPSSEQLDDPQIALIEGQPLDEHGAPKARAKLPAAANTPEIDRTLPAHLPRETQHYRPETTASHSDTAGQSCGCTACGGRLRQIGQDVSEQLEYVPARFKVIRHVRPKLACVSCQAIFQAAAPSRPIARGLAGPGLLAHVMVSKYCDHTPLYRQSGIYARSGVHIDRSTMAGWVDQGDALLDPLVAALGRYALAGAKVHADDTPVKVLDPGRGRTKTGRLWCYAVDDRPWRGESHPAAAYVYAEDHRVARLAGHLATFKGVLQVDGYNGFKRLAEDRADASVRLAFAGRHNVVNALAAAGAGCALGLGLDQIAAGLEAARPAKGRCVWRRSGGITILDDTYNANPSSLVAALDTLAAGAGAARRVVVLGDMLELGAGAEAAHREAGRAIAAAGVAELIGVGRHARTAVEAARASGLAESHHTATFEDTVVLLLKRLVPGDALLVKGSRGMRMEQVVDALMGRFGGEDG